MREIIFAATLFFSSSFCFAQYKTAPYLLSFKEGRVVAELVFAQGPVTGKESVAYVYFKDQQNQPVELQERLEVVLWMPDMNHGSAPTQVQRLVDSNGQLVVGAYLVRNLQFIMGGLWEVRVSLVDKKTQAKETQSFRLTF